MPTNLRVCVCVCVRVLVSEKHFVEDFNVAFQYDYKSLLITLKQIFCLDFDKQYY